MVNPRGQEVPYCVLPIVDIPTLLMLASDPDLLSGGDVVTVLLDIEKPVRFGRVQRSLLRKDLEVGPIHQGGTKLLRVGVPQRLLTEGRLSGIPGHVAGNTGSEAEDPV